MVEHHPMDALHDALAQMVSHVAVVDDAAAEHAAAVYAAAELERQNTVNDQLTDDDAVPGGAS